MKATTIVLIAAAPIGLLIWLFWRRKKLKQVDGFEQDRALVSIAVEGKNEAALEVEGPADPQLPEPLLPHAAEKPHEEIDEQRQPEPPAAPAAADSHQSQSEATAPADEILESHSFAEACPDAQAAASEQGPATDFGDTALAIEILPEQEIVAEEFSPPAVNGQPSTEQPAGVSDEAGSVLLEDLQSENQSHRLNPLQTVFNHLIVNWLIPTAVLTTHCIPNPPWKKLTVKSGKCCPATARHRKSLQHRRAAGRRLARLSVQRRSKSCSALVFS